MKNKIYFLAIFLTLFTTGCSFNKLESVLQDRVVISDKKENEDNRESEYDIGVNQAPVHDAKDTDTPHPYDNSAFYHGDTFDLVAYLKSCGASEVNLTNEYCSAYFYEWEIRLYSRNWAEIPEFYIENTLNGHPYFIDPMSYPDVYEFVVCNNGIPFCKGSINKMQDVILALYESGFAFEPPIIHGLIY